jgi:hypothetical protein
MRVFHRTILAAVAFAVATGTAQGDVIGFDEFPARAGEPGSLEALIQSRRPKLPVDLFGSNPFNQIFVAMDMTPKSDAALLEARDGVSPGGQPAALPATDLLIEDFGSHQILGERQLLSLLSLR